MRAAWLMLATLGGVPLSAQSSIARRPDLSLSLSSTGAWESNLDHDQAGRPAYGGIMALGLGFRDRPSRTRLEASYEVAFHRYSVASRWDRVSHQGELALTVHPSRWIAWKSGGEISLRGSADDRDLSDTYQASQGIGFRLGRKVRLDVEGAWRLRRYHDGSGRDGPGRSLEAELSRRVLGDGWMTLGGKYEFNRADSLRYRYHRTTYTFGLSTAADASDRLELEFKYRVQRYDARRVDLGDRSPRRRDDRMTPSISFTHRFRSRLDVMLGYEYEHRSSNDPSKEYDAHQTTFTATWRW